MGAATGTTGSSVVTDTAASIETGARPVSNVLGTGLGLGISVAAIVLAVVIALITLASAVNWQSTTFFGALLTKTLMVDGSQSVSDQPFAGLEAGLLRGDQIIAINNTGLGLPSDFPTLLSSFRTVMSTLRDGQRITVGFLRDSDLARQTPEQCAPVVSSPDRCNATYILSAFGSGNFLAYFVLPWASGVAVLLVGLGVMAVRPRQGMARGIVIVLMALSIFLTGLFDLTTSYRLTAFWVIVGCMLGGLLIALAFIFPTRSSLIYRQPLLRYLPLILAGILGAALAYINIELPQLTSASDTTLAAAATALIGLIGLVIALLLRRRYASSALARDQINTVFIGVAISFAVAVIWFLNVLVRSATGSEIAPLNLSAASPFFIIPALSLAYAVLRYRSYNTDRVLSIGVTYVIMLAALVIGYFLLVFGASIVTQTVVGADNPVLVAVVIFIMAVLFVPVRTRVQARVDKLFYRQRADYQARVEDFARALSSTSDIGPVVDAYESALLDGLQPAQLFVFLPDPQTGDFVSAGRTATDIRFGKDSAMVAYLRDGTDAVLYLEPGTPWAGPLLTERARLHILRTLVIAPFRGSEQLRGFCLIAPPQSGAGRYVYEELRYIESLSAQMTISVERSQVVDSLQRRVRELDVLGQVSQAVNFTLEFDDLLELVSTQADKLIEASHFYIVLREGEDELYYAFFLEDDERYREREDVRWPMGRDLYSDVIRTGQPLRVSNFAREMAARGIENSPESAALRQWMGVPLISGSNRLGVIAAGSTQASRPYTDEQLKIFGDIAALAATSLERARLFRETNARARQLSALNDISRQIVASEINLEELLQIITASATDILDAEAGSLLLTADDGTNDLIFRVAIGGSGSDIIGVRVPAKRGLVGEVASTARPVIVPDVASDARWGGELGKGPFTTHSVIAVPLISQSVVIGVLEVLNKRGGGFNMEDADLLNTFAGQAAVAIENARLFQLTDQQLSMRVAELETMERIDVELNRSLDLINVARITVEWSMENTSATAALLGIVEGDPAHLRVVYGSGYGEGDLPAGSDGVTIPLERGIVARVMRSRQAELVPDVTMDRDYVPSLNGSLSQITIPMLAGGTINALLILETNREPRLRLADMPFLQRLAEHASIAIANAQLYAELERANQSKSEFVSFVAHELKNPLTSIRGYSEFLLGGQMGGLSETQASFVTTIRSNAERMNTLVSDLNDVTKLQTNNMRIDPASVRFSRVLDETVRPLQKQLDDKGLKLEVEVPATLPPIYADEGRIIQVMTNLLSNAYKYTPSGGTVSVRAYADDYPRDASGRSLPPSLIVSVRDTGIGMSEDDLNRLFTPYFRSENPQAQEQPGTGLGMTITRGIIQAHGGEIGVESSLGEGTTFWFSVPLALEAQAGD